MLDARGDEYLEQLDNTAKVVRSIGTGKPRDDLPTRLVEDHLPPLSVDVRGGLIGLNPPQAMLTAHDDDNRIFAMARPLVVDDEPFELRQREILLDRVEAEKALVRARAGGVDVREAATTMSVLADESFKAVFEAQATWRDPFYNLQQACQPGPSGKVVTPFRLVNAPISTLTGSDAKALTDLLKDLPGRRACDFSKSVDTILVLDEIQDETQAKQIGRFGEEIRAVAVMSVHKSRKNGQAVAIHKSQFGTLHRILRPEDSYKRYLFAVAGSTLADAANPFAPTATITHAAIAAGKMIRHSDKIALPPSGDRMPIDELSGEVRSGWPIESLVNTPDPMEMPGVNRVNRRTDGFHVLNGASTMTEEPTFQLASVTRCYNDLVKNVSELLLTKLFTADTPAAHRDLKTDVDRLIMDRSGSGDDKPFNGGRVLSIENATSPDGTPRSGVVEIKLAIDFKYLLYGIEVKVIPEELTLTADTR